MKLPPHRTSLLRLTLPGLLLVGSAAALAGPPIPTTQATPTPAANEQYRATTFRTLDAYGKTNGSAKWHWTTAGGNCCEVYVAATASGRLLEYGGTWPLYSDDRGKTWTRVVPITPLQNGEGAIIAGPHGDVFGVAWDPYSGDHLQGIRYRASSKQWNVAEAALHSPLFDREWITYIKGPFRDENGRQVPFITLVRGGTLTKAVHLIATDGVSYTTPSVPRADMEGASEPIFLDIGVKREPDADYWQPATGALTLPMNAGGVLLFDRDGLPAGADAAWLTPATLKWQPVRLAFRRTGPLRQDSRGWLTMATRQGREILVQLSRDGGRTWKSTTLVLPESHPQFEGAGNAFEIKVNGRLGRAVIATRAIDKHERGQDLVWSLDISTARPRLRATYAIGRGDVSTTAGVLGSLSNRFDFRSVALLPDGRIAVSFDDSTTPKSTSATGTSAITSLANPNGHSPALAILDVP